MLLGGLYPEKVKEYSFQTTLLVSNTKRKFQFKFELQIKFEIFTLIYDQKLLQHNPSFFFDMKKQYQKG